MQRKNHILGTRSQPLLSIRPHGLGRHSSHAARHQKPTASNLTFNFLLFNVETCQFSRSTWIITTADGTYGDPKTPTTSTAEQPTSCLVYYLDSVLRFTHQDTGQAAAQSTPGEYVGRLFRPSPINTGSQHHRVCEGVLTLAERSSSPLFPDTTPPVPRR